MIISSQLLHQIADPTLPKNERAQLRCKLAKQLEDVGNYEVAREAMGELWPHFEEYPALDNLDEATAAEVLLRTGTGTVARIAYELIIHSSAHPSLIGNHTLETKFWSCLTIYAGKHSRD